MTTSSSTLPENAVWFVTGCSSGIGAEICKYAFREGHRVVATARKPETLSYLEDSPKVLKLAMDVTSKASIDAALRDTLKRFGRIDVLVNNAGFGTLGVTEAMPEGTARLQMETNFWGAVNLTREAVRIFRQVNPASGGIGGVVVQVSSIGGRVTFPGSSFYHASKFALEGFTESIALEMSLDWNIKFLILEPGGTRSNFAHGGMMIGPGHPAYTDESLPVNQLKRYMADPKSSGEWVEPFEVAKALFDTIGRNDMPRRLVTGIDGWTAVKANEVSKLEELEKWKDMSCGCGGGSELDKLR